MMSMGRTYVRGILGGALFVVLIGAILFGLAGRWELPMFWAYLGVWLGAMVAGMLVVDPTLIQERMWPGPGGKDYATVILLSLSLVGQCAVAALDVGRYHLSDSVPFLVQIIAFVAMIAGAAVVVWAEAVNRFFSPVIRIQSERGHHVITTGPYRYVRHPGYAACPLLLVGGALVLGSYLAAAIGVLMCVPFVRRTIVEDRILHEQLEGYREYAQRVKYRLFPGVW
jgi:protein-S-isoprenylcysteine O-methyltransferase Ste14